MFPFVLLSSRAKTINDENKPLQEKYTEQERERETKKEVKEKNQYDMHVEYQVKSILEHLFKLRKICQMEKKNFSLLMSYLQYPPNCVGEKKSTIRTEKNSEENVSC